MGKILIAEDDEDDRLLAQRALDQVCPDADVRFVDDGETLLDYLRRRGCYTDPISSPRPDVVFLDLNMRRMDGREVLSIVKDDANLRSIPIVVLTTSKAESDVRESYELGANSFASKPVNYDRFVALMKELTSYWFDTVSLPTRRPGR